jgi:hypothetical protein
MSRNDETNVKPTIRVARKLFTPDCDCTRMRLNPMPNMKKMIIRKGVQCAFAALVGAVFATTASAAQLTAEQQAAMRARAEESRKYLEELTANMMAEAEARAAARPPVDPAVAKQRAEESARKREADWQATLEAARPFIRSWGWPGDAETIETREQARAELQELARKAEAAKADAPRIEAELDDISVLLGAPRVRVRSDGSKEILGGQIGGQPVYRSSLNLFAGAGISADELWPTNSAPWPHASTGRSLTGTNITLGLWENDGAVLTNHAEFGSRAWQVDHSATNPIATDGHATAVAGTMAAGGFYQFTLDGQPARLMRGVAFEARINAYDTDEFKQEVFDAAAGTVTGQPLRLANHSWGYAGGWTRDTIQVLQGGQTNTIPNAWIWRGDVSLAEEWKFGFYFPSLSDGTGCVDLDGFLATNATRHLAVYAAGNDRLFGPGSATTYYYKSGLGPYDWTGVTNPPAGSRDWRNGDGDTGGYDTMLAPGTAKNVLTVGAVRDIYHVVSNQVRYGYGPNAVVTLAPFSACGPTDDGRIKPEIVAVGQSNSTVRTFGGLLTPANNATNGYYLAVAGTSFAAPGVSGGLGLAAQRRAQLFPNLDPVLDAWRGSTWRAAAIHTADDVGAPGPDYQGGYGPFNAVSLVAQVELDQQHGRGTHIKEFQVGVGQATTYEVDLDGSPFRATLTWSDPAGVGQTTTEADTTPRLVNNLDLRVERVGTTNVYYPWVLNPDLTNKTEAARAAAATQGVDNRNNVEQVVTTNAPPGRYRIVVTHSGGLSGGPSPSAQWVSLLTTGDTPLAPAFTSIVPNPSGTNMLLTFTADPGAYLHLRSTTDFATWQTNATLRAEAVTNSVLVQATQPHQFWQLVRQQ